MTIASKLWLGFGILILLLLITDLIIYQDIRTIEKDLSGIATVEGSSRAVAYAMEIHATSVGMWVLKYLDRGEPPYREQVKNHEAEFEKFKAQYDRLAKTPRAQELSKRVGPLYQEYKTLGESLLDEKDNQEALFAKISEGFEKIDAIIDKRLGGKIGQEGSGGPEKGESLADMESDVARFGTWLGNNLRTPKKEYEARLYKDADHFRRDLNRFKNLNLTDVEAYWAGEMGRIFNHILSLVQQAHALKELLQGNTKKFLDLREEMDTVLGEEIQILGGKDVNVANEVVHPTRKVHRAVLILFVISLIGSGAAIVIGRGISKPVRRLIEAAHKADSGMLDHKVEITTEGEVDELTAAFNRTLEKRQQAEEAVREVNENLERRVSERTEQLEAAQKELQNQINVHKLWEEALQETNQTFKDLIQALPSAIIILGPEASVRLWNPAAERLFGWREQDVLSRPIPMVPKDKQEEYGTFLKRCLEGEVSVDAEVHWQKQDGSPIGLRMSMMPMRDAEGNVTIFVLLFADLHERKRDEETRAQLLAHEQAARAEAEAANRAKDQFLALISHELRKPLTSLLGWARLLRAGQLGEVATARAVTTIERSAKSHVQIIEEIVDVSDILGGKLSLDVRPVELVPIIEGAIEAVRPAANAKAIRIRSMLDAGAGSVSGDPDRLQQVVRNLLSNAVESTPKSGRVQVRLERVDSYAQITVSDTGAGISAEFLPHVFDRLRQADPSTGRHSGLGLGLAIARHLMELHGGTIHAESPGADQGSIFTVRLPLRAVQMQTAGLGTPSEKSAVPHLHSTILAGLGVLVVDNEADARDLLTVMLEQYGAKVIAVPSAGEALEAVKRLRPDVLVSDVELPGEDGYALIGKVRALEPGRGGQIPAVALTTYAKVGDRLRALSAGYHMHVSKPVDPAELVTAVASVAGRTGSSERPAEA
jgi:PAS domain S-box-containing protein